MYGSQGDGRFRLANTRCGSLPDGGIGMTDMSLSKAGGGRSGPIVARTLSLPCPHSCGHLCRPRNTRPEESRRGTQECARHRPSGAIMACGKHMTITRPEAGWNINRTPVHPGEMLREEFIKPLGISINGLALELHVPVTRVSEVVNEYR